MAFELTDKLVGVVRDVRFKVSPHNAAPVNDVHRRIDYSALTLADVLALADATTIIKMQRQLRSQKPEEILQAQGAVVDAGDAGKTPETPETIIGKLRAMGLSPEQIAELAGATNGKEDDNKKK